MMELGIWDLSERRGTAGILSALGLERPYSHGPAPWGP